MFASLRKWGLGKVVGVVLHRAAEGKYGARVQRLYWFLSGKKTAIGTLLGLPEAVLQLASYAVHEANLRGYCAALDLPCPSYEASIAAALVTTVHAMAAVGAFLLWLGQIDGALKIDPPEGTTPKQAAPVVKAGAVEP